MFKTVIVYVVVHVVNLREEHIVKLMEDIAIC